MTGNELLDLAFVAAVATLLGALFGSAMKRYRIPLVLSVFLAPVGVALTLAVVWFLWIAIMTMIYGHPGGNAPLAVALGATILIGPGLAIAGFLPSIVGCFAAYASSYLWRHSTARGN